MLTAISFRALYTGCATVITVICGTVLRADDVKCLLIGLVEVQTSELSLFVRSEAERSIFCRRWLQCRVAKCTIQSLSDLAVSCISSVAWPSIIPALVVSGLFENDDVSILEK